ncbi:MAG: iron-containing alcohol dehydrogenase [Treponema sp.]|nr:iron-containing alcohol dehydrogenase [Treponema sp.]
MNNFRSMFSFELPTKITFGPGCVKELTNRLLELGVSRPLIVTDTGITVAGVLDKVLAVLPKSMNYQVFDGVEANPKDVNVSAGAEVYRAFDADCILAIGGGSPIDCAKSIGVLAANVASGIKAFEGKNVPSKPLPPLVCVPTTSGTGSELTFSSVITDTRNKYKMTVKNAFTAPKAAICDPELTLTVPTAITAATGMDALTHAIEAFTATCSEPISDAAALYAIELIYGSLVTAFNNGSDIEARSRMLMGSMLAGIAFSHSDVASVHCIAESLGGMYDLPHGICNAIVLPYIMEYCMDHCEQRYARIALAMGLLPDSGRDGAMAAVDAVKRLAKEVMLPSFASLNVNKSDYAQIAAMSAKNISTESNPRPMTEQDYLEVLKIMA